MLLLREILVTKVMVLLCAFSFSTGSLGAGSYPLSYVYSGYYYWDTGMLYTQTVHGDYWSSSIASSTYSYRLAIYSTRLIKADSGNKRNGRALRCQIDMLSLIRSALPNRHIYCCYSEE